MPERIQLRRTKGWRKPQGAIVVARPSSWGNPFRVGTRDGLARVPAIDGSAWEYEGRISAAGNRHDCHHADGTVTEHWIRYMTRQECVDLFETALTAPTKSLYLSRRVYEPVRKAGHVVQEFKGSERLTVELARAELAGRDLACWCPPWEACHADVLIRIANEPAGAAAPQPPETTS